MINCESLVKQIRELETKDDLTEEEEELLENLRKQYQNLGCSESRKENHSETDDDEDDNSTFFAGFLNDSNGKSDNEKIDNKGDSESIDNTEDKESFLDKVKDFFEGIIDGGDTDADNVDDNKNNYDGGFDDTDFDSGGDDFF